jgi:hypothetical protein
MKLKAEIRALRQEHLTQLQLLQQYDPSTENNDDTDEVAYKGNTSLMQLDEVVAPTIEMTDKNYFMNFASYLQKVEAYNKDLRRKQGQLEKKFETSKANHSQLKGEVTRWKDTYEPHMNQRKELTNIPLETQPKELINRALENINACKTGTASYQTAETTMII